MSKTAKKGEDALVDQAIALHNAVFAHHKPSDAASRFEKAVDVLTAMRQDRGYAGTESWAKINNESLPDFYKGIQGLVNHPIEKIRITQAEADTQIAWFKVAAKELEAMENKGFFNLAKPDVFFEKFPVPVPAPPIL